MTVDRIVRTEEVCELTGLSRSTIYRKMRKGTFPSNRLISDQCVGWRLSEINKWFESL